MILKYLFLIKDKLLPANHTDIDNIINTNRRIIDMLKSKKVYNAIDKYHLIGGDYDDMIQSINEMTLKIKDMQNIGERLKIEDFREIVNVSINMLRFLAETKQKYGEQETRELQNQIVEMVKSLDEFL